MDVVLRKGAERLEVEASIVTTEVLRRTFRVMKNLEFFVCRARSCHGYPCWLHPLVAGDNYVCCDHSMRVVVEKPGTLCMYT